MRTTLTLDDDVAARLERERRTRNVPLKELVNEVLRAGLAARSAPLQDRPRFQTEGLALGPSLVGSLDNVEEVLARVEGERHR
jgi:hypothetical protein